MKKKKNIRREDSELDSFDLVNRYGTYNIQPTNSSDNTYPAIAQGLDKKEAERLEKEKDRWLKEDSKVPQRPGN